MSYFPGTITEGTSYPYALTQEEIMTTYRDRHLAGLYDAPDAAEAKTVDDLKTALKALDQPVSGSKAELEKRLAKAQKEAAAE